jgi:hypothetical protein
LQDALREHEADPEFHREMKILKTLRFDRSSPSAMRVAD